MPSSIQTIISQLQTQSAEKGITLYPPATEAEIARFEQIKKINLPDDLRTFYSFCNGLESEEDMFRIVPLEEILEYETWHKSKKLNFHFAEYMTYCDYWNIIINPNDHNAYTIYNYHDDNENFIWTKSFPEFIGKFLSGGVYDGLYALSLIHI